MVASNPQDYEDTLIEERINGYLTSPELTEEQKARLTAFREQFKEQRKPRPATQDSYLRYVYFLGKFHKKKYEDITKDEIKEYLASLKGHKTKGKKNEYQPPSEAAQSWAKLSIKVFYRWLLVGSYAEKDVVDKNGKKMKVKEWIGSFDKKAPYPDNVAWLKVSRGKFKKIKPEDCLTIKDFKALLAACKNQRDRALLYVLFDSGARISELLNVQLKHVRLEGDMPYIELPKSKSIPRPVYLMDSIHELASWLKVHPQKKNKEAFLFPNIKKGSKRPFMDRKVALYTVQRIAARAKLDKKITNHIFRHTSATFDRKDGMPDQFMQTKYGWSETSRMVGRYAHIQPEDVGKWQRKVRGLPVKESTQDRAQKKCPRCEEVNTWDTDYCKRCAAPLDMKAKTRQVVVDADYIKRLVKEGIDEQVRKRNKS